LFTDLSILFAQRCEFLGRNSNGSFRTVDLFLLSDKRCVKSRDVKIYQISYIDIF